MSAEPSTRSRRRCRGDTDDTQPIAVADIFRLAKAMPARPTWPGSCSSSPGSRRRPGIQFESIAPAPRPPPASIQVVPIARRLRGILLRALRLPLPPAHARLRCATGSCSARGRLFAVESVSFAKSDERLSRTHREHSPLNAYVYGTERAGERAAALPRRRRRRPRRPRAPSRPPAAASRQQEATVPDGARKRVDPLKAKAAKQKKIAIGGVVVLCLRARVPGPEDAEDDEGPGGDHRRCPCAAAPAAPVRRAPAPADGTAASRRRNRGSRRSDRALPPSPTPTFRPQPNEGQLVSFERFASKDPFAQQAVSTAEAPSRRRPPTEATPEATVAPAPGRGSGPRRRRLHACSRGRLRRRRQQLAEPGRARRCDAHLDLRQRHRRDVEVKKPTSRLRSRSSCSSRWRGTASRRDRHRRRHLRRRRVRRSRSSSASRSRSRTPPTARATSWSSSPWRASAARTLVDRLVERRTSAARRAVEALRRRRASRDDPSRDLSCRRISRAIETRALASRSTRRTSTSRAPATAVARPANDHGDPLDRPAVRGRRRRRRRCRCGTSGGRGPSWSASDRMAGVGEPGQVAVTSATRCTAVSPA